MAMRNATAVLLASLLPLAAAHAGDQEDFRHEADLLRTSLQAKAGYYEFSDLDVDRYDIDGAPTQVLISTRELKRDAIPSDTWESTHLRYTHGVGVAMAPANHVDADGLPSFVAGGVPTLVDKTVEGVSLKRPQVYFGETASSGLDDDYAIVDTNLEELLLAGERIALENRLDLMNARANVMDARRQIEVAANRLRAGDLGFRFTLDIVLKRLNKNSSNFVAEQLIKTIGAEVKGVPGSQRSSKTTGRRPSGSGASSSRRNLANWLSVDIAFHLE